MKVLSCQLENFASYKSLDFQFDGQGLTLIQGPTGAGKSTLCDAIPWVLFGTTAKGGTVDEIISWPGTNTTKGIITVTHNELQILVLRSRGASSKDNDLYYQVEGGQLIRGKDLRDTQKLLNEHLGLDADLYLAGAYFHEFSKLAQFFTTTAKNRKDICEQIVDLTLAKNLQAKTSDCTKTLNKSYTNITQQLASAESQFALLTRLMEQEKAKHASWETAQENSLKAFAVNKARLVKELQLANDSLSIYLNSLEAIDIELKSLGHDSCTECGAPRSHKRRQQLTSHKNELEKDAIRVNNLIDRLMTQISEDPPEAKRTNPYTHGMAARGVEAFQELKRVEDLKKLEAKTKLKLDDLDLLNDVVKDFRGTIIKNTLLELEQKTSAFLSDYFDAEIKATFSIEDADKIEVAITKDGNNCAYTQLSKGQRCMLKLCFGISVMDTIQNHHGVQFNAIWLDESLDGLSDAMKAKAFRLFEFLETKYSSVFVVDHSTELKALFNNSYHVELINGYSEIKA